MAARRGVAVLLLVVVAGLLIGSLLGELFGSFFSSGWAHNLSFLSLTFGLILEVNLVGVVGILLAAVTLRYL